MKKEVYDPTKPFGEQIRKLIQKTHPKEGVITVEKHGKRFRIIRDNDYWKNFNEMIATDGIGTKGKIHYEMGTLAYGVQDVFAMVVDDLMEYGYIPAILQDHILLQEENEEKIFTIVKALRDLCLKHTWEAEEKSYPIIISGGETAIINTLQGFEMGITAIGYVKKGEEIFPRVKVGDEIIGIKSNGIHSNGLTFLRQELFEKRSYKLDDKFPWGVTIGEELTKPTHVYMPALKELLKELREEIHGMVHITGGGNSKLRELIPAKKDVDIKISREHELEPQEIFYFIYKEFKVPPQKMYTRFNNGWGYAIAIDKEESDKALRIIRKYFPASLIGKAKEGKGRVIIESQYDDSEIIFET